MTKAVIFDLGRVIVPFELERAYTRITALTGIPEAEVPGLIQPTMLVSEFESGRLSPEVFHAKIAAAVGMSCSFEDFSEIWNSIFSTESLISEAVLEEIGSRYPMVLLSNTNAIHFRWIRERFPLLRHFRKLILSYEVGAMKPEPLIYERAIAATGCRAEECFFTDDIPEYVEGARRAGIDAVQFLSADQAIGELRKRGVL